MRADGLKKNQLYKLTDCRIHAYKLTDCKSHAYELIDGQKSHAFKVMDRKFHAYERVLEPECGKMMCHKSKKLFVIKRRVRNHV